MGKNQVEIADNDVNVKHVSFYLYADGCKAMRVNGIGCHVTCLSVLPV